MEISSEENMRMDESVEERPDPLDEAAVEAVAAEAMEQGGPAASSQDVGPIEPIVDRCERLGLDVSARLRLFQTCCRMIHRAHQRGRIFGDLAISRLGVGEDGEAAEIPSPPSDHHPTALTAFTSPEQVLGEPPTTAADVYALGVVLYDLLTDRPPIAVDPSDPSTAAMAISDQAPQRPSLAAPADCRPAIGGDLDAIVLEALRKEPERRYASAAALADDLDAYLAGLPVRAGRTSEWGRVVRFIKRRTWVVPVLTAALLGVLGSGAWMIHRTRTLTHERDLGNQAAAWSQAAMAVSTDRLTDDEEDGQTDAGALRRDLLTGAREHYQGMLDAMADRTTPSTDSERADAQSRIAAIDLAMDRNSEAASGFLTAISLWRKVAADNLGDPGPAFRLAEARAGLARALDPGTKGAGAEAVLGPLLLARDNYQALVGARPADSFIRRRLARVLHHLADLQDRLGKPAEALESARSAVGLLEELALSRPLDVGTRVAAASVCGLLARLQSGGENGVREAFAALSRAIALLDATPEPARSSPRIAFETACRLIDLADLQRSAGSVKPAAATISRASTILDGLLSKAPEDLRYRAETASACNLEAATLLLQGRRDDAAIRLDRARTLLDRLMAEHPGERRYISALAVTRNLRGRMLAQAGRLAEARKSFQGAADLLEGIKEQNREAADAYALACNLSLGLSLVGVGEGGKPIEDDDPSLTPADRARRDVYARRALDALRKVVAKGYDDPDLYRRDPALDPLRAREDFRKLLSDLAARPKPPTTP